MKTKVQDNEEKKQNKDIDQEERKQNKRYNSDKEPYKKDEDYDNKDDNYKKDYRHKRGNHSRGSQRYSKKGSSRYGGNYKKNYSRKKVSRLYKLLGSSKKLWDEKINYKNVDFLRNFISESGKITPRRTTGVSPLFHRKLVREIKKARSIALLPFRVRE